MTRTPRKLATAEAAAGETPAAAEKIEPAQAAEEPRAAGGAEGVKFIKNIDPSEPLLFSDGSIFTFPGTSLTTSDERLVKELTRLAKTGNHGILIA